MLIRNTLRAKEYHDNRGTLFVIEKLLPFDIKRLFYIVNPSGVRGGHRHIKTRQALIALSGDCLISIQKKNLEELSIRLNNPDEILIIEPEDWHTMSEFSDDCLLLVLASEQFDPADYIHVRYS